jgi:hypothetical protein
LIVPDPVIHLYWAYALAKAEEMFKLTRFPPGEREYVTLDPKKITCPFCSSRSGTSWAGQLPMVPFWAQLREPPPERTYLPLAAPKILGIEHAEFLAVRSLALDPVVGPVVRYVHHVAWEALNLEAFRERVLLPEVRSLPQPKEHSRARRNQLDPWPKAIRFKCVKIIEVSQSILAKFPQLTKPLRTHGAR